MHLEAVAGADHRRHQQPEFVAFAGQGREHDRLPPRRAVVRLDDQADVLAHDRPTPAFLRDRELAAVPALADFVQQGLEHLVDQARRGQQRDRERQGLLARRRRSAAAAARMRSTKRWSPRPTAAGRSGSCSSATRDVLVQCHQASDRVATLRGLPQAAQPQHVLRPVDAPAQVVALRHDHADSAAPMRGASRRSVPSPAIRP